MKHSGVYLPEDIFICWKAYARIRGGRMSRNNVIEELTRYLLCPDTLVRTDIVEQAIQEAKGTIEKMDLGKEVKDGNW